MRSTLQSPLASECQRWKQLYKSPAPVYLLLGGALREAAVIFISNAALHAAPPLSRSHPLPVAPSLYSGYPLSSSLTFYR